MNARQGSSIDRSETTVLRRPGPPLPPPAVNGAVDRAPRPVERSPAEVIPDLTALERSVRHLDSDSRGVAHVIIVCTTALLAQLRRIERKLGEREVRSG